MMKLCNRSVAAGWMLLSSLLLGSCAPELELDSQTLSPDLIEQEYSASLRIDSDSRRSWSASAMFKAPSVSGSEGVQLPAGDTLTVNGQAVTYSESSDRYYFYGEGDITTLTWVWTNGATTYTNSIDVTAYLPLDPYRPPTSSASFSKSADQGIQIADVPSGVVASTYIYSRSTTSGGASVRTEVTGEGTGTSSSGVFSNLPTGPGYLSIQESTSSSLQAQTAAGGTISSFIQIYINVNITD